MDIQTISIEDAIIRQNISHRGGGIEIDLSAFGIEDAHMAAYANYLGGGMLGKVCVQDTINGCTPFVELELAQQLTEIGERLKRYAFAQFIQDEDVESEAEFEALYQQNQKMPVSAY